MVIKIEDIKPDRWVNIEATVMELWDNEHPAIRQVGLLKDSSGIVKFVSWEKSVQPLLELGKTYRLEGMPVTQYEDRLGVALVRTTLVTPVQQELPRAHERISSHASSIKNKEAGKMTKEEIEDYKAKFPNRKYYVGTDGKEYILNP